MTSLYLPQPMTIPYIDTPPTNLSSDRSRHSSNNQTTSLPPLIDRTTKTTYKLRQQPKLDYRLFITPSKL